MSLRLNQPVGQVRHTNIAIIRYKINNKRFEVPCYKNKAINYRNGVEKDLDEVLQVNEVFINTSKGEIAGEKLLQKFFGNLTKNDIIKLIIEQGELQISNLERDVQIENMFKDIANILVDKCVHPDTKRPFSLDSIKSAIKEIHFPVKLDQSAKRQALQCFKQLKKKFYISRAEMKIKISCNISSKQELIQSLKKVKMNIETQDQQKETFYIVACIQPSTFRDLTEISKDKVKEGQLEILVPVVVNKDKTDLEDIGCVNLQRRPEGDLGSDEDISSEDEATHNKKQLTKAQKKKLQKQTKKEESQDEQTSEDELEEQKHQENDEQNQKQDKEAQDQEEPEQEEAENDEEEEQVEEVISLKKKKQKKNKKEKILFPEETKEQFEINQQSSKKKGKTSKQTDSQNDFKTQIQNLAEQEIIAQKKLSQNSQVLISVPENTQDNKDDKKFKCSTCSNSYFNTKEEFRSHYKTQWHLANLKRKNEGKPSLNELEYRNLEFDLEFIKE